MKIRIDFVTNSSSSCFVLGFKPGEKIATKLADEYEGQYLGDAIQEIKNNLKDPNNLNEDDEEELYDLLESSAWWQLYEDLKKEPDIDNIWSFQEKYPEKYNERLSKNIKEYESEIFGGEYDRIAIVEWGDHTKIGREMEQEVFPKLSCTLLKVSRH